MANNSNGPTSNGDAPSKLPPWLDPKEGYQRLHQKFEDASIVKEHRIDLPLSVDEYHIGQLYSVAEASKNETGGGDGVEVVMNEPFDYGDGLKGQYTLKIFHLSTKVPKYIKAIAPKTALELYEEAWNCYPYCRTVYTNGYMKDAFYLCLDTWHKDGKGDIPNVHNITGDNLKKRDKIKIDYIDIVNPGKDDAEPAAGEDPRKFRSEKADRGPWAGKDWSTGINPVMCAYKLYYIKFKWWGLQNKVEDFIVKTVHRVLLTFHRQVVCWLDKWYGMTVEDIRALEDETKKKLDDKRKNEGLQGTVCKD